MTMRRKLLTALGAGALVPRSVLAQAQTKIWRVGFLAGRAGPTAAKPDIWYDTFTQSLRELGYAEGKNLVIEWRFADGQYERLPALAAELVRAQVDVIATHIAPAASALQSATKTIPIVAAGMGDAVVQGFTNSLARPSGNVTGLSNLATELGPKRLELLHVMVPKVTKTAVLQYPGTSSAANLLAGVQSAAKQMGIKIVPFDARTPEEIERAFAAMARERVGAVLISSSGVYLGQGKQIAALAIKHRLPVMSPYNDNTRDGVLMSYGQDTIGSYRQLAGYVAKILRGVKVNELPIEQPTRIHLAVNRKTAQSIGVKIPAELILRADEVIE